MKTLKQLLSNHHGRVHYPDQVDLRRQAVESREDKVAGGKQTLTEREVRMGPPDQLSLERDSEVGTLRHHREDDSSGVRRELAECEFRLAAPDRSLLSRTSKIGMPTLFNAKKDRGLVRPIRERFAALGRWLRILSERPGPDESLSECTTEVGTLRQALTACDDDLAALKQRPSERTSETRALRQALDEGEDELGALKRQLTEHEITIAVLDQSLAERKDELAAFKRELRKNEARIATLNQSVAERTAEIGALRQALANREPQGSSLDAAISALHTSTFSRVSASLRAARRLSGRIYYSRLGYPLVLAWRALTTCSRAPLRDWRAGRVIARSELFDRDWYLQTNPDVAASGIEPVWHYVAHGAREGRDPSPSFSTAGYLADNADVSIAGINPLAHFVLYGAAEGRAAGVLSSTASNRNKDIPGLPNRITVLTTKHTLFIGHLIDHCLSREGYSVSVIDRYDPDFDDHGIYIVVCPQMFAELPPKFVAFQMEQSTSSRWFDDRYKTTLANAVAVLDYSLLNIAYLNKCEIPHSRLFHVPINPIAGYRSYLVSRGYKLDFSPRRKTSVLFYGDTKCARRREFLERLRARLEIKVVSDVYGQDLFNEVIGARVVVNVHYYHSSLLETTRICEALSLGIPVVSEESVDIEQYGGLRTVVDFTKVGDAEAMITAVERLLSDENVYEQRIAQIYSFVGSVLSFSDYLRRFLVAQGAFPFRRFLDTSTLLPRALPATPRICLSVPENAARRTAFTQRHQEFLLFDGVRYDPGWVGCGMSYKYIFSKLLDTSCSQVIICEDDVLFEAQFPERLGAAIRFLESTHYQWDVFSGLIADLHADTEILRIVEFEDNEYIFINKMTSTVFNIYNRSSFVKLAAWDETNYHVNSNTIDRYMESSSNFVVTTLPFLVGHDEGLSSSIWNFQNSRYRTMLDRTCGLLERKVTEFKRQRRRPA